MEQVEVDVVKGLKAIEELKVNLLQAQWLFQHGTASGVETEMIQGLSDLIALSYLVSKRIGFDFSRLDRALIKRLEAWRAEDMAGLESQWGDISLLYSYLSPED